MMEWPEESRQVKRAEQFFNNRWGTSRLSINPPRSLGVSFRKNFDL